ncbi:MAG TPA: chemotaxis protein CheB [Pirellulales bacterium]|nr:chemotaxis protein CheB [Pirellulales bacterium]
MPGIKLIVIGGSAGGLPALLDIVRGLPADLPVAICVAIHTSPYSPGRLPEVVDRQTQLPCLFAEDRQPIVPGQIYFAPVDRHLIIHDGVLRVTHGPRENGFRPAVDPLFRSAARAWGPRVAGIVLSGSLGDGSFGLACIKQSGGIAIVQNPDEAIVPSMPLSALRGVAIDHVVGAAEMAALIVELAKEESAEGAAMSSDASRRDPAEHGTELAAQTPPGKLTPLTCPECGGTLWEQEDEGQIRFRCHVGHGYNAESLLQYHSQEVEAALWTALRVLEEHAVLQERLSSRAASQGLPAVADQFHQRCVDSRRQAEALRAVLLSQPPSTLPAEQINAKVPYPK